MNNKKLYTAPAAELILLMPRESIASWTWKQGGGNWWHNDGNLIHWSADGELLSAAGFGAIWELSDQENADFTK